MRILAMETATAVGSVALLQGSTPVAEVTESVPMRHLEWLAPTVRRLLAEVGWRPEEIEGLAVSIGPGSFTGLRIGIATAGAWAKARGIPVVGVPTLAVVAMGVQAPGLVCPVLDVRRGEVAAALFRQGRARVMDDVVGPIERVLELLPRDEAITFAGDGLERYGRAVLAVCAGRATIAAREQWAPHATATGLLAIERLSRGERDDPYLLLPTYGRHPAVEEGAWGTPPSSR